MINVMNPSKESTKDEQHCLDPHLWHACAGAMVQMPQLNSKIIYFPQGHFEHAQLNIDPKNLPKIPALIPCKIASVKYLADPETDEVYSQIRLIPLREGDEFDIDLVGNENNSEFESGSGDNRPGSFAKTLTQSDANNGGGFSVPRYCAETIFPRLDYSAEPPVQTILAKDVHGVAWKFRHIYRGTPRRHLLTTGWSHFVNQKKLVAGDSIVFLRGENGDLRVGIRRAKRGGIGCGPEYSGPYFGGSPGSQMMRSLVGMGPESVIENATRASNGTPFVVVYYPRGSTPEFCVKASSVRAAMGVKWCSGMRFKMAFETEDSSRISWFMGTICSMQAVDSVHWPNSPWRLLQVVWDEPDLLQNVKRVNPWLVEPVASMPAIHISPFTPPRKKLRVSQPSDFPFPIPQSFSGDYSALSPSFGIPDKICPSIQGTRHNFPFTRFLSDLHLNKLHSGLVAPDLNTSNKLMSKSKVSENSSKSDDTKTQAPKFMLFGKPILTEDQISGTSPSRESGTGSISMSNGSNGSFGSSIDEGFSNDADQQFGTTSEIFIGPDDVGLGLTLSTLGSYKGLYKKIAQRVWHGKVRDTERCAL